MKKILFTLLIALTFACEGGNTDPQTKYEGTGGCPAGRIPTTVNNICIISNWGDSSTHQVDRPSGGWVFLEIEANADQKKLIGESIEAGLKQTIAGAKLHNPGWYVYTQPASYGIVMIRKQATNQDGTPALLVNGNIQTAGTVINAYTDGNPRGGEPVIVLPQPDQWPPAGDPYWSYLQASARNEGEHVIEWRNDLSEFLRRAVTADIHPHWPLADEQARGIADRRVASFCLTGTTNDAAPFMKP